MSVEARAAIAADFVQRWKSWAQTHDAAAAEGFFADDAIMMSPAFHAPKTSKAYAVAVACNALAVFENFRYVSEWLGEDGVILAFEANVGPHKLRGIDRFVLDDAGRITCLEVMIRPLNALEEVAERMKVRFAAQTRV